MYWRLFRSQKKLENIGDKMLFKKYFKHIATTGLALLVFVMVSNSVSAKKVTNTTYTYYPDNVIKTRKNVITDGNKLIRSELYSYKKDGKVTTLYAINYGKNNKKLVSANYKYANNKKLKVKISYYYNTHTKKQKPLSKAYVVKYYNSKGKHKKTVYKSKDAKRNAVVAKAKKQVGKKYKAGGKTPKGFDCSGLTGYVYKKTINKKLGSHTGAQTKKGKYVKISTKTLKKGDLVFWGSKSSPYHVGIYIGNGKYVHAETYGVGVNVRKLSSFKPSYAKRVIY
ncbi:cell wall-associated NlpC family hydrolase [Bacilli bacterium PM5-3]|nr:cell wall-associated NlpC family hydrolase [Bacilli bacterium PM5-3]MDH6603139.1 cell wall-associated NlpC family hydrolase [Bacilli bacterium PM5-9]